MLPENNRILIKADSSEEWSGNFLKEITLHQLDLANLVMETSSISTFWSVETWANT